MKQSLLLVSAIAVSLSTVSLNSQADSDSTARQLYRAEVEDRDFVNSMKHQSIAFDTLKYRAQVEDAEFVASLSGSEQPPFDINSLPATATGPRLISEPSVDCCTPF